MCSVFIWCHCIQDSWSYKLIPSAYLCDRNVEALLWLNRSFTILFISLPPSEKCVLHFTIRTSTFTTGSFLPLSGRGFLSPYLEHSTCVYFSLMRPERTSYNPSLSSYSFSSEVLYIRKQKVFQFSRDFFTPSSRSCWSKPVFCLQSAVKQGRESSVCSHVLFSVLLTCALTM